MGSQLLMPAMDDNLTQCVCVCARVCVSYPSRSRSSWSAMSFGLAVSGWLTFEPPPLHYTLKTLTNATHKHKKINFLQTHIFKSISDISSKREKERRGSQKRTPAKKQSWQNRTYDLAVTSTYWPGRKCAAYRGVPGHTTNTITFYKICTTLALLATIRYQSPVCDMDSVVNEYRFKVTL